MACLAIVLIAKNVRTTGRLRGLLTKLAMTAAKSIADPRSQELLPNSDCQTLYAASDRLEYLYSSESRKAGVLSYIEIWRCWCFFQGLLDFLASVQNEFFRP